MSETEKQERIKRYYNIAISKKPFLELRAWRIKLKLTQKEFGALMNINNSTVSDYETGTRGILGSVFVFNRWYFALENYEIKKKRFFE